MLLLGLRAPSVDELLTGIQSVPDSAIYYRTHRFLHQQQSFSPEPPNDFAYWANNVLGDGALVQITRKYSGILTRSVAGTAQWIKQLLGAPDYARQLAINGREHIRNDFLIARHIKDYLLPFLFLFKRGELEYL